MPPVWVAVAHLRLLDPMTTPSERVLAWRDELCPHLSTSGVPVWTYECADCLIAFAADAVREEREALVRLIILYDKAGGIHVGKLLAAIRARTPASGEGEGT